MTELWCIESKRIDATDWQPMVGYAESDPTRTPFGLTTREEAEREATRLIPYGGGVVEVRARRWTEEDQRLWAAWVAGR